MCPIYFTDMIKSYNFELCCWLETIEPSFRVENTYLGYWCKNCYIHCINDNIKCEKCEHFNCLKCWKKRCLVCKIRQNSIEFN